MSTARAADPQPYAVHIQGTGVGDLDAVLRSSSQLVGLKDKVPVPPFALIRRAQSDISRLQTALDSFGYYLNSVSIRIAGHALEDAELPNILDAAPADKPVKVEVAIDKGPLFHVGQVTIDGTLPKSDRAVLDVKSGDPVIAATILDARGKLLTALQEDGYALAKVEAPVAIADNDRHTVDLTYKVETGPRVDIGRISFTGLKDVNEGFVRNVLTIKPGERYSPSRIDAARRAVAALTVFSGVSVHVANKLDAQGRMPLTFDVQERPKHAVSLTGTYSTDLGISLGTTWSDRNLFGNAEQLNLSAAGTGLGTATAGLGYNLSAQFLKPQFWRPDQQLELGLTAVKQQLDAYDQTAEGMLVRLHRKFSPLWSGSAGVTVTWDRVLQENTDRFYRLIALPVTASYDSTGLTDLLHDPIHGARASLAVTPTQSFGIDNLTFLVLQASGSTYFDLAGEGRSVLALRALAGSIIGGSNLELPPDQRLYAGGSATVRGFAYQSIGPQFPDHKPDRREIGRRRHHRVSPAHSGRLRRRRLRRCRAGQRGRCALQRRGARGRRCRRALLYAAGRGARRHRRAGQSGAGRRQLRTLYRIGAGVLTAEQHRLLQRIAVWAGGIAAGLALLIALLLWTPPGHRAIAWMVEKATGGEVVVEGLSGALPASLKARTVELRDTRGVWLRVTDANLVWSPFAALNNHYVIRRAAAAKVVVLRRPLPSKTSSGTAPRIDVDSLSFPQIDIAPALIGYPAKLAAQGSLHFTSIHAMQADLIITRPGSRDHYTVKGAVQNDVITGTASIAESPDGLLGRIVGFPGLGPIALSARASGDRAANDVAFNLTAGRLSAKGQGRLSLARDRADIDFTAASPVMQLNDETGWASLTAEGHVHGAFAAPVVAAEFHLARLHVSGLAIDAVDAHAEGRSGTVDLTATANGLRLPGSLSGLFAAAPVQVAAHADLNDAARPVRFTIRHPLMTLDGTARTASGAKCSPDHIRTVAGAFCRRDGNRLCKAAPT